MQKNDGCGENMPSLLSSTVDRLKFLLLLLSSYYRLGYEKSVRHPVRHLWRERNRK